MAINTSDLGGGGVYRVRFFSGINVITTDSSGTLIDITAPEGMIVRIEALATDGTTSDNRKVIDITLEVDGVAVVDNKTLIQGANNDTNGFCVSENGAMAYVAGSASGQSTVGKTSVSGIIGHNIKVIKNTGVTENLVFYSYSFGEIK